MARPWWRQAVVYEIYIRSFADGDGDGLGDVPGIRSRLEYLRDLGVDAIWITPWYRSPFNDGGYDVADYRQVDPRFGSNADAQGLIADAHELGLRVLVDLVPNHTSSEHEWFVEALAAAPGDPARDRYWFRDGSGPDGAQPPNDWRSVFGGPAWEQVEDGQWYLHLFDPTQPDLNWSNPEVRTAFEGHLRFWLDRGVDGFRVDVAHSLMKDPGLPDLAASGLEPGQAVANHPHWDRDELHEIVRGWREVLDSYDGERMMVAEAWVEADRLPLYLRGDEYHQSFDFDLLKAPWDASEWRRVVEDNHAAAVEVGSTSTWVLANHDVVREATRYGLPPGIDPESWLLDGPREALDPTRGARRARAAALAMFALPGAAYVYQGQELGLPEVFDLPTDVLQDPVWERSGHTEKGRDGCRVPLPWRVEGPSFGFGDAAPWLPQPPRFAQHAVEEQDGVDGSSLELFRAAIRMRGELLVGSEGMSWLDRSEDVLAFARGEVVCVANFGPEPVELPTGEVLLVSSELDEDGRLPPDTTAWVAASAASAGSDGER